MYRSGRVNHLQREWRRNKRYMLQKKNLGTQNKKKASLCVGTIQSESSNTHFISSQIAGLIVCLNVD